MATTLLIWHERWVPESVFRAWDELPTWPYTELAHERASAGMLAEVKLVIWDGEALRLRDRCGLGEIEEHPVQVVLVDNELPGFAVSHTIEAAHRIGAHVLMWPLTRRFREEYRAPDRLVRATYRAQHGLLTAVGLQAIVNDRTPLSAVPLVGVGA